MLRAHEFDKVEILALATPEQAPGAARRAGGAGRGAIAGLGLPYRIIEICTGDMGQSHHRSFDIEVVRAGRRPAGSRCRRSAGSATTRRAGRTSATAPRRRQPKGTEHRAHAQRSALAVPRVWAAIVENYRQPDGSVAVPEVLRPYMRGIERIETSPTP